MNRSQLILFLTSHAALTERENYICFTTTSSVSSSIVENCLMLNRDKTIDTIFLVNEGEYSYRVNDGNFDKFLFPSIESVQLAVDAYNGNKRSWWITKTEIIKVSGMGKLKRAIKLND